MAFNFSGDPMQIMSVLQNAQQNPMLLEQLAGQLASNPQMPPPAPGSMQQGMDQIMNMAMQGGGQLAPQNLGQMPPGATPPIMPPTQPSTAGGPMPMGVDLGTILGGAGPDTSQGMSQEQIAALANLKGPEPPRQLPPAYIGNLAFGSATPAQGLQLPQMAQGRGVPGGLGRYL